MATNLKNEAYKIYQKLGQSAVIEYGLKNALPFDRCSQCESETPTVADESGNECLLCGANKQI